MPPLPVMFLLPRRPGPPLAQNIPTPHVGPLLFPPAARGTSWGSLCQPCPHPDPSELSPSWVALARKPWAEEGKGFWPLPNPQSPQPQRHSQEQRQCLGDSGAAEQCVAELQHVAFLANSPVPILPISRVSGTCFLLAHSLVLPPYTSVTLPLLSPVVPPLPHQLDLPHPPPSHTFFFFLIFKAPGIHEVSWGFTDSLH